ncbi:MAG: ubiquinone/menaquinone biosynthesis methyltransferase, partial [Acidobacteria bacterium]|nr:ubiquinone/menaquinone biosynthesis methyltransferase [Acidobacteriota bacterium]
GTGDLTLALWKEARRSGREGAQVWGSDFAHPMLCLARKKHSGAGPQQYVEADALNLPFPDGSCDLVTAAFGFRNLANYEAGLREIFRVLRPGGEAGILEFSEPRPLLIRPLYRFYFRHILPRIGGAISGSNAAYSYLPASVLKFPSPEELAEMMTRCGFADVLFDRWSADIVALHCGRKP